MKRSYDTIALFYDRLARLIYGNALVDAQLYLLRAIPPNARILIAGGGTGWILEEITRIHSSGLSIIYIDISEKMIALAEKRNVGGNKATFINAPVEDAIISNTFDVVITPFLLDNFTEGSLQKVFSRLDDLLISKGLWLYCDFQNTNVLWQKTMLKIMYLFFRSLCGIEASQLPDANACFTQTNYNAREEKMFLNGFVTARIYEKTEH